MTELAAIDPPGDRADASDRRDGAQVVGRAIDILLAVARLQRAGATMPAIIKAVGLNRSTCFRLVRYLTRRGLLEQDVVTNGYFVGQLAFELGLAARTGGRAVAIWQPRIDWVRDQTGMTVYLVARSDLDAVCLATAEATSVVRVVPLVPGQRLPLGIGAGSLALLAACGDDEIANIVDKNQDKFAAFGSGAFSRDYFLAKAREARLRGYAESTGTVAEGVHGLGVAVPAASAQSLAVSVASTIGAFAAKDRDEISAIIRQSFDA